MTPKSIILIVEDETSLRTALNDTFQREGFTVLLAKNGLSGIEAALHEHPDIILLDLLMPLMDGLTMLSKLRENSWGKNVKVIILTNVNNNQKIAEAVTQGSFDYLIKSDHTIEQIVMMVKSKLKAGTPTPVPMKSIAHTKKGQTSESSL